MFSLATALLLSKPQAPPLYLVGAITAFLMVLTHYVFVMQPWHPTEHCRALGPKQPLFGVQDTLFLVIHMITRTLAGECVLRKEPRNSLVLRDQQL